MAEQDKTPEEILKQQIWKYTGWTILLTSFFASGTALGYILWGDACGRCEQVKVMQAQVSDARSKTETVELQWGQKYRTLEREYEREKARLEKELAAAKGGAQ